MSGSQSTPRDEYLILLSFHGACQSVVGEMLGGLISLESNTRYTWPAQEALVGSAVQSFTWTQRSAQ